MLATEILNKEHRLIEEMISIINAAAIKMEGGERIKIDHLEEMIDFVRSFADNFHHAKEEKILFALLHQRGMPIEGGPISVMLTEHTMARDCVENWIEAIERAKQGDESAWKDILNSAMAYAILLAQHIQKEDNVLYPMGDRLLSKEDQAELLNRFHEADSRQGEDMFERYKSLANKLKHIYRT